MIAIDAEPIPSVWTKGLPACAVNEIEGEFRFTILGWKPDQNTYLWKGDLKTMT